MVKKLVRPAVLRKKHASQRIFLAGHNWGTTRKWRHPPETTESRGLSGLTVCPENQRSGVQVAPGAPSIREINRTSLSIDLWASCALSGHNWGTTSCSKCVQIVPAICSAAACSLVHPSQLRLL